MAIMVPVCNGTMIYSNMGMTMTCSNAWTLAPYPSNDFSGLVSLLTFDQTTCEEIIGGCLVLFVFGYSMGFVARMLTRR